MVTTDFKVVAAQPLWAPIVRAGRAGVVVGIATRILLTIADELRIRRDLRQLRAMDDHMLKDIGLTRADIGKAVRYGRD